MPQPYDRTIITGGNGMLAKALIRALRQRGVEPIALDRATLDITSIDAVLDAVQERLPTLIVNCAAYTKVDQCEQESDLAERININGAANLAAAAKTSRVKLVHFSTDFVFNGRSTRPYQPTDPTDPLS